VEKIFSPLPIEYIDIIGKDTPNMWVQGRKACKKKEGRALGLTAIS